MEASKGFCAGRHPADKTFTLNSKDLIDVDTWLNSEFRFFEIQTRKFRLEFFDQILKFEKDCVADYEANGEILKNKLELLVNKIRPFYDDWKLTLSKPDLDEEKLKDANQLADLYINEIRFQQQLEKNRAA